MSDQRKVTSFHGYDKREYVFTIGDKCVIEPQNPRAKKNRGRECVILSFDDPKRLDRFKIRYLDTNRVGWVDPSNLVMLEGKEFKFDRDEIIDEEKRSDYLWCLHCERTYKRGKFRLVGDLQMCPYPDCDGDTIMDAWDWESIRDIHPEYPRIPEKGVVYPQY